MQTIRGKKALVAGAASDIGQAVALRLAEEGADVFLLDQDDEQLQRTADRAGDFGVEIRWQICDFGSPEQVRRCNQSLLEYWPSLDILVNNTSVLHYGSTRRMTVEQWDWLLAANLYTPLQLVQDLLPAMLLQRESHVVNVASMWGLAALPGVTAYPANTFPMVGLSESLRANYARQGLGVTAVCPGLVSSAATAERGGRSFRRFTGCFYASPDRVAELTVRAIYGDRPLVLATPLAGLLYWSKRCAPGVLEFLHRRLRRGRMRRRQAERQAADTQFRRAA